MSTQKMKRYNLVLPDDLFNQVQDLADRRHTTVAETLRKFIKLGLLVMTDPGVSLIRKEGDNTTELLWL